MQSLAKKLFLPFLVGTIILFLSLIFVGSRYISISKDLVSSMQDARSINQKSLQVNVARTNFIYALSNIYQQESLNTKKNEKYLTALSKYQENKLNDIYLKYENSLETYRLEIEKNKYLDATTFVIYASESISTSKAILLALASSNSISYRNTLLDKWISIDEELDATLSDLSSQAFILQKQKINRVEQENDIATFLLSAIAALLLASYGLKFIWIKKIVIAPIRDLSEQITKVDLTAHTNTFVSLNNNSEIGFLANVFNDLLKRIKAGSQELAKEVLARELKEVEAKNLTASLAIEKAKLIQAEKLSALGTLVGGVAHEISNPLMGIISYLDYLSKNVSDAKNQVVLKKTNDQIFRIQSIVNNMLLFARTGSSPEEESSGVELGLILNQVVDLLAPLKKKYNVEVNVSKFTNPIVVKISTSNLQQVLLNIIKNALEAAQSASSKKPEVNINAFTSNGSVIISISDNGAGITPENQIKIFEPFFTTKPPGQGTGLGLAISREIINSAGGTIKFDENFKNGAKFDITLPLFNKDTSTTNHLETV